MDDFMKSFNKFLLERKGEVADYIIKNDHIREIRKRSIALQKILETNLPEHLVEMLNDLQDIENEERAYENEMLYKYGLIDGIKFGQGLILEDMRSIVKATATEKPQKTGGDSSGNDHQSATKEDLGNGAAS